MGRPGLTVDRMPEYVDVQGDCWVWARRTDKSGYGKVNVNGASGRLAHRVVYEMLLGAIPDGLTLDHLCRNPPCVNPDHLEPVTQEENMRRSPFYNRTHCRRGHEYTPDNIYVSRGGRRCRACCLRQERATPLMERTTCVNGHPYIPENRYIAPKTGHSACRICLVANTRRYRAEAKAAS